MRNEEWHEIRERRKITEDELSRMKLSTRKSWAVRSTRWMSQIPHHLLNTCVKKNSSKKNLKTWCLENIPTTGDRILRGRGLEEGRPEAGDVGDNGGDGSGGGYPPEKRQQRMMQKWLQGSAQNQVREHGQIVHQENGGKEKTPLQTSGEHYKQLKRNYYKLKSSESQRQSDINVMKKESEEKHTKNYHIGQDKGKATRGLPVRLKNKNDRDIAVKRMAAVLISILLVIRGIETIQNVKEGGRKHKTLREMCLLKEKCTSKADQRIAKSLRTGIG